MDIEHATLSIEKAIEEAYLMSNLKAVHSNSITMYFGRTDKGLVTCYVIPPVEPALRIVYTRLDHATPI